MTNSDVSNLGKKTWKEVSFDFGPLTRKKNRVIGLSFPENNVNLGLEPSILTVLPQGDNVEYSFHNIDFNDEDVQYYVCSVYISGMDEFKRWAVKHDFGKIIVGGYHPTSFPEEFRRFAHKIVLGMCDDLYETIKQDGQEVVGKTTYKHIPRYDLYDVRNNQQIIPDKKVDDIVASINTSQGCPYACDFCCTPLMSSRMTSKPLELVQREVDYLSTLNPKFVFIRDENFPLQRDWRERLQVIAQMKAKIYLFASANLLNEEMVKEFRRNGVYMVCLGLEDIWSNYTKNNKLDEACKMLENACIYKYLSFIVNPLKIVGQDKGKQFYADLLRRFESLKAEMVCGNFLMPFRGTKLWDEYYHLVSEKDYKSYDSKSAFLIKNEVVRKKMEYFMFWHQWQYFTSDFYNDNLRKFAVNDTLFLRFKELYDRFVPEHERLWNVRG